MAAPRPTIVLDNSCEAWANSSRADVPARQASRFRPERHCEPARWPAVRTQDGDFEMSCVLLHVLSSRYWSANAEAVTSARIGHLADVHSRVAGYRRPKGSSCSSAGRCACPHRHLISGRRSAACLCPLRTVVATAGHYAVVSAVASQGLVRRRRGSRTAATAQPLVGRDP
jgi:hypothetical protein